MALLLGKKRASKKKSPTIELPDEILVQYSRVENFLRHSLSRKWLRYELDYDEIEKEYFFEKNTYKSALMTKFPRLNSTNMSRAAWNKVRKLTSTQKPRRFSSKFVQQQRIDLEKFRRSYNILADNGKHDQLSKLNVPVENMSTEAFPCSEKFETIRLIIELKKILELKFAAVRELRDINSARSENQNVIADDMNSNANANNAVYRLKNYNFQITASFNKLICYQVVKDAFLFDALSKKKLFLALSPEYYGRKNELRIYEDNRMYRVDLFIELDSVYTLMDSIRFIVLSFIEKEQLVNNVKEYVEDVKQKHLKVLKLKLEPDNFEYLGIYVASLIDLIINFIEKKISTQTQGHF